nr:hypothetical protein [Streptomyces sp.]
MDHRDEKLFDVSGPGEAQNGAAAETEFAGDGSQAVAAFDAFVDLLVAFAGAGDQRPRPSVHVQFAQGGGVDTRWWAGVAPVGPDGEGFTQVGAVSSDDSLDGFGEVVQQVPGIGNLPGLWCTGLGAFAEGAGTVAADNPHLGVFAQPCGEGVRGAVREDIDRAAGAHVDEDRRVGTTAAHSELVDTQTWDRLRPRNGQCAKEAKQGVLAGGDGQASAQTGAGTSAQKQGDVGQLGGEGIRAARVSTRQVRDLLGESSTPAAIVAAHESTCPQVQSYLPTSNGTVRQTPLVVAVHSRGSPSASWAGGRPHRGPHGKTDLSVPKNHLVYLDSDPLKKEVSEANHIPHAKVMPTRP